MHRLLFIVSLFLMTSCDLIPEPNDPDPIPEIPENPADLALGTATYEISDSLVYSTKFATSANITVNENGTGIKVTQTVWDNSTIIDTDIFGQPLEDYIVLNFNFLLNDLQDPEIGTYNVGENVNGIFGYTINGGLSSILGKVEIQEINLENNGYMIGSFDGVVIETPVFNGADTIKYNITNGKFNLPLYY